MLMTSSQRSGGEILVDTLRIHGVDTVFCLPGESFLAAIDALSYPNKAVTVVDNGSSDESQTRIRSARSNTDPRWSPPMRR